MTVRYNGVHWRTAQLIAIRLDVGVLRWAESLAAKRRVPYQLLIKELLAGEV